MTDTLLHVSSGGPHLMCSIIGGMKTDPHKLTHAEARAMAQAVVRLAQER
jgi:hypothetical protein